MTNELIELIKSVNLEKVKEAFIKLRDQKIKRTISRVIDTLSPEDLEKALEVNSNLLSSEANKEPG